MKSKKNPKSLQSKTITLHVTEEFYKQVTQLAAKNDILVAELIRGSIIHGAKAFLRDKKEREAMDMLALGSETENAL